MPMVEFLEVYRLRAMMRACVLALAAVILLAPKVQAADVTGVAKVVDGDTLIVGAAKVRLQGIDAPETDQVCLNAMGIRWNCGIESRDQLVAHIAGREITCASSGIDAYKRTLGICKLLDEDLNGWMVQEGWAIAYVKYSTAYVRTEEDARAHERGLWKGAFIAPWDWRHRNSQTIVRGALSVPIDAQRVLLAPIRNRRSSLSGVLD